MAARQQRREHAEKHGKRQHTASGLTTGESRPEHRHPGLHMSSVLTGQPYELGHPREWMIGSLGRHVDRATPAVSPGQAGWQALASLDLAAEDDVK